MSHIGKLSRGLKWYEQRTALGLPHDIQNDPNKMVDVDYFVEHCKTRDMAKVIDNLVLIKNLQRSAAKDKEGRIEKAIKEVDEVI